MSAMACVQRKDDVSQNIAFGSRASPHLCCCCSRVFQTKSPSSHDVLYVKIELRSVP